MLFVIILGVLLLAAIAFFVFPGFSIDKNHIYKYNPEGKTKQSIRYVEFEDEETYNKLILEFKKEFIKEHKLTTIKLEEINDSNVRWNEVPCDVITTKHLKWNGLATPVDDGFGTAGLACGIVFLIGGLLCGGFAIGAHCNASKSHQRVAYERVVNELEFKQNNLYNTLNGLNENNIQTTANSYIVYDMGSIALTINDYNTEVLNFKEELYHTKLLSENPWTNWYVCPVFKEIKGYNKNATNYKDILGENLKVFIPSNN